GGLAASLGEHLVELFYTRVSQADVSHQRVIRGSAATHSQAGGSFEFVLADGEDPVGEKVRFVVSAPSGKTVGDVTVDVQAIHEPPVVISVDVLPPTEPPAEPAHPPVVHVNGQLIDPAGKPVPCGMQVTIVARLAQSDEVNGAGKPVPIMVARADRLGAFFGDVANEEYAEAAAIVSGVKEFVSVALQDGHMPSRLLLAAAFPEAAHGAALDDCGCHDLPPRNATQADIAYAPDTYSTDLGACGCPQFNTPNLASEEVPYHTVLRTPGPAVRTRTPPDAALTRAAAERPPPATTTGDVDLPPPVIATSFNVQLNVREIDAPGRIRTTLVTADDSRRVLYDSGPSVDVSIPAPAVLDALELSHVL